MRHCDKPIQNFPVDSMMSVLLRVEKQNVCSYFWHDVHARLPIQVE